MAAWLVLGLGIVLLVRGLARRIGANLAEREGLAIEESTITVIDSLYVNAVPEARNAEP